MIRTAAVALAFLFAAGSGLAEPPDPVSASMRSAKKSRFNQEEFEGLRRDGFIDRLERPTPFAPGDAQEKQKALEAIQKMAVSAHDSALTQVGDAKTAYDVIIQVGHYARTKGITGTQGKYVSEQQLAALLASEMGPSLSKFGLSYLIIGADDFQKDDKATPQYEGLKAKAFLALHADGSSIPCLAGPSVGYETATNAKGMHAVAAALAISLGQSPLEFLSDSRTIGLRSYYSYKQVRTEMFEGVLEVGELTCPEAEEQLLLAHSALAYNLSVALAFAIRPAVQ